MKFDTHLFFNDYKWTRHVNGVFGGSGLATTGWTVSIPGIATKRQSEHGILGIWDIVFLAGDANLRLGDLEFGI